MRIKLGVAESGYERWGDWETGRLGDWGTGGLGDWGILDAQKGKSYLKSATPKIIAILGDKWVDCGGMCGAVGAILR